MAGGSGVGDGGDCGGDCVRRSRCLRVKAAFAGGVKFLANTAFAARAAITAAVVWLWWELW